MKTVTQIVLSFLLFFGAFISSACGEALLQMKVKDVTYRGKLVAFNNYYCWLMDRDGSLHRLQRNQVREHRSLTDEFRRLTTAEMRNQLRKEFGKEYEVTGTSHFLLCAAKGRAKTYAPVFENVYRSFYRYLSARGFKVKKPEFPLVAIVFPNHKSFVQYSRTDGVRAVHGLSGYYIASTNRVALFDSHPIGNPVSNFTPAPKALPTTLDRMFAKRNISDFRANVFAANNRASTYADWHGSIEADLQDTIVHETTHQVAFNTGLHSRVGENPRWVVEGLATVFESPDVRNPQGTTNKMRINRERFIWFDYFAKERRKPNSLEQFVSSDSMFKTNALDAYSQAWALSFFLIESRSADYSRYLKTMATHDPTKPYKARERLEDFTNAFGDDLKKLDRQFVRYIERLK